MPNKGIKKPRWTDAEHLACYEGKLAGLSCGAIAKTLPHCRSAVAVQEHFRSDSYKNYLQKRQPPTSSAIGDNTAGQGLATNSRTLPNAERSHAPGSARTVSDASTDINHVDTNTPQPARHSNNNPTISRSLSQDAPQRARTLSGAKNVTVEHGLCDGRASNMMSDASMDAGSAAYTTFESKRGSDTPIAMQIHGTIRDHSPIPQQQQISGPGTLAAASQYGAHIHISDGILSPPSTFNSQSIVPDSDRVEPCGLRDAEARLHSVSENDASVHHDVSAANASSLENSSNNALNERLVNVGSRPASPPPPDFVDNVSDLEEGPEREDDGLLIGDSDSDSNSSVVDLSELEAEAEAGVMRTRNLTQMRAEMPPSTPESLLKLEQKLVAAYQPGCQNFEAAQLVVGAIRASTLEAGSGAGTTNSTAVSNVCGQALSASHPATDNVLHQVTAEGAINTGTLSTTAPPTSQALGSNTNAYAGAMDLGDDAGPDYTGTEEVYGYTGNVPVSTAAISARIESKTMLSAGATGEDSTGPSHKREFSATAFDEGVEEACASEGSGKRRRDYAWLNSRNPKDVDKEGGASTKQE